MHPDDQSFCQIDKYSESEYVSYVCIQISSMILSFLQP